MAERFRLLCVAKGVPGFYGGMLHYPKEGIDSGHKRAGRAFALLADGLRYDSEGRMEVTKEMYPILPKWVEAVEPLKKIDPKTTPHVVVEQKARKPGRRKVAAVLEAAPEAWPANSKKHLGTLDDDREVKIKRAGTTATLDKEEDNEG